jgi:hypothetical protein
VIFGGLLPFGSELSLLRNLGRTRLATGMVIAHECPRVLHRV